uniref:Uncharacterized protein n=1 Tax=Haptolina brevifila TaxID=156173 RepID=A0A7S2ILC3_9EUKA
MQKLRMQWLRMQKLRKLGPREAGGAPEVRVTVWAGRGTLLMPLAANRSPSMDTAVPYTEDCRGALVCPRARIGCLCIRQIGCHPTREMRTGHGGGDRHILEALRRAARLVSICAVGK